MRTYDIIVAIHQIRKIGDKTKQGPESLISSVRRLVCLICPADQRDRRWSIISLTAGA